VISFQGQIIHLSPHQSDILRVLLNYRARPVPLATLIQRVYGITEPDQAATSIRVAIHALRRKLQPTGLVIRAQPKLGYEVDTTAVPALNHRICDQILMVLNRARAAGEREIAEHLQAALDLAEAQRHKWLGTQRPKLVTQTSPPQH